VTNFEEIRDGDIQWRFDKDFLQSNWTCIWGRGCHGIGTERNDSLNHGCCSFGAELDGPDGLDEARNLSAAAATIPAHLFQFHAEAEVGSVFADESYSATRVVDGACIFLNRSVSAKSRIKLSSFLCKTAGDTHSRTLSHAAPSYRGVRKSEVAWGILQKVLPTG
jgi:hypothetical protein